MTSNRWRLRPLILWNCIALLLCTTFLLFSETWNQLDLAFLHFVNKPLENNYLLRVLWALSNHSLADWFEDLCILGFYLAAIWKSQQKMKRGIQFFFCIILTASTILLLNRLFCRDFLHLRRASPSLVIDQMIDISNSISWIYFKVHSSKSLPGDHATSAMMFAISYAYLVRGRLAILALLYGAFLCIPRLAVGAHWLSDIVVGSGCIVIFAISWAFFTPLADRFTFALERGIKKFWPRKSTAN